MKVGDFDYLLCLGKYKIHFYTMMIYKINKQLLLSLVLLVTVIQTVKATEITTTIDRNRISINESFQITFSATELPDGEPDFSPLEKDFQILHKSQNSHSSWVNGQTSKTIEWVVNVMSRHTGSLVIPPITFGRDFSQATTLLVTKKSTPEANQQKDLFIQVEATPETAFVQSQIIYTLRLYHRVRIVQAKLNEPKMANAVIEKIGEDKNYTTQINGVDYAVIERKYAIFPQKSGISRIEPIVLTAEVVSDNRRKYNSFFSRQGTKTEHVISKAITLDIQAAPDNFTGNHWIPAAGIKIEEKWSGDPQEMKVGEPLTRTLRLIAKGTTVAQLPQLHKKANSLQLKTYPDQAVLKEQKSSEGIIALREEKIAFIPSKAGSYVLSAIEIPWFNTETQKMEIVRIPEMKVIAKGSILSAMDSTDNTSVSTQSTVNQEPEIRLVENKVWMWLSIFLACGWLATVYFLIQQGKPKLQKIPIDSKEVKIKETVKALKLACTENNAVAAKNALLAWGKIKLNSSNLAQIATLSEARLRDEIMLLSQSLYANQSEQWEGKKLFQSFTENSAREKVSANISNELELLNKIG